MKHTSFTSLIRKDHLLPVTIYLVVLVLALFLVQLITKVHYFSEQNMLNWDAEHYHWIKNNGYEGFRVAFFPLFPLVWKITCLSVPWIAVFNTAMFIFCFLILAKELSFTKTELLIFISFPNLFFLFLPYSESIFFLSSTLILFGLRKNYLLVVTGLFLSTLSRPAFTVLLPAVIITELLTSKFGRQMIFRVCMYILVVLLAVLMVAVIQHYYTGEWFKFFEVQKCWNNYLQMPCLPLTTWGGGHIIRLDAVAFLTGFISAIVLIRLFFFYIKKKIPVVDKVWIFSLAYLAGICMLVLLFRGGSLFSLNRFVFCTPFFFVFLHFYFTSGITHTVKQLLLFGLLLLLFWLLLFNSWVHIQTFLKFFLLSAYVILYSLQNIRSEKIKLASGIIIIAVNFVFQIFYFLKFLDKGWVA